MPSCLAAGGPAHRRCATIRSARLRRRDGTHLYGFFLDRGIAVPILIGAKHEFEFLANPILGLVAPGPNQNVGIGSVQVELATSFELEHRTVKSFALEYVDDPGLDRALAHIVRFDIG
jgi:hypothetical protein